MSPVPFHSISYSDGFQASWWFLDKLQYCIIKLQATNTLRQHQDRFQGLGDLGGPYKTHLRPDAKPFAITTARRVALPLLDKVRDELKRIVNEGIITKVEESTEWCAGMVIIPKPNGTVRICVDLVNLKNPYRGRTSSCLPARIL